MDRFKFLSAFNLPIIILFSMLFANCGEDGGDDLSTQLIGTWSITDVTVDIEVDDIPVDEYLKNGGLTEDQENELEDLVQTYLNGQPDDGDIEFKSDFTYVAVFDSNTETGSWSYDTKTGYVTLMPADNIADSADSWRVLSVTDTNLVVGQTDVVTDDINEDGIDEKINFSTEIRLDKV